MDDPLRVRLSGPLEQFGPGFAGELKRQGYVPLGVIPQLRLVAHLSRWMLTAGLAPEELSDEVIERFFAQRREAGHRQYSTARAMAPLMAYLRQVGALAPASAPLPAVTRADGLAERFACYLRLERGLVAETVAGYVHAVKPFLVALDEAHLDVAELSAAEVTAFVVARCSVQSRGTAKMTVTALRAGEVAGLSLDDVDWRAGELVVIGKGRRSERLPLPVDVGAAVAAYLENGRPEHALDRAVFVRVKAPVQRLGRGGIAQVVMAAGQRAGLGHVHAHRLRHTAATEMLRAGVSLPQIGQVLRHRELLSTAIYAKVDRAALRLIARPWPEVRS